MEDLASRGLIRILSILSEYGELNITQLARVSGLNYNSTRVHCETLKKLGLVREKQYGRIKIIEVVFDSFTIRFEKDEGLSMEISPCAHG